MKHLLLSLLIIQGFYFTSYSQKNITGLYEGEFWNNRCVLSIKIVGEAVAGALYTGRNTKYSILGTYQNGQLSGNLQHSVLGNGEISGMFRNDSMIADVVFEKIALPLRLKHKSKYTDIDFDKYFGKPGLDDVLLGTWIVFQDFNKEGLKEPSHTKLYFGKDGTLNMFGNKIIKDRPVIESRWYTSEKHLYIDIRPQGPSMEIELGEYKISNDTLTVSGVGRFAGTKTVYLKGK